MSKNKKDSVFSGIFPSNEPAPQPAPSQQSHRPAAAVDQVAALNTKIELMERNILGQIEKKLAKQVSPPPSQPPTGLAPAVISKMTEMESRLKDFQEKFLLGAAQMKNIEESKISARREIEELLKVVREQQKYSELDRGMHDQLEKAWRRVEELEKRMMEVYSAAAKKPAEPAVPAASPAEIAAAVLKAVDARLGERLAPFETALKNVAAVLKAIDARLGERLAPFETALKNVAAVQKAVGARLEERLAPFETALKNVAAKIEAGHAASHGIEGRVAELSAAVDARLAGFSQEIRQTRIDNFAGRERMEEILAEVKKDVLSSVREIIADGNGVFLKHADAAAIDGRERTGALAKLLVARLNELAARGRDNALKADAFESCVRSWQEKALSGFSSMQRGLESALRAHIDAAAAGAAAENGRQLEKIKEAYSLSASNAAAISVVAGNVSEIEARLGSALAGLKAFIKALELVNIEALQGVSGAVIRRSLAEAGGLASGLENEVMLQARAKGEIEGNIKPLF